jgi:hypothetical protein
VEASLSLEVAPPPPHLSTLSLSLIKTQAAHSSLFMQLLSLLSLHSSLFMQLSLHSSLPPPIHQGKWSTSSFFNGAKREYMPYNEYKKVARQPDSASSPPTTSTSAHGDTEEAALVLEPDERNLNLHSILEPHDPDLGHVGGGARPSRWWFLTSGLGHDLRSGPDGSRSGFGIFFIFAN